MAQFFQIHPDNPQLRLIKRTADIIREGGVVAYPTDSSYALGCHIGDKFAMDRIRSIRQVDDRHNFTLVCRDLSEISSYVKMNNWHYRFIRNHAPGPFTFILPASREVPRRLQNPRRKTIGLRVPDFRICLDLLQELGEPIMSSTLILPGAEMPMNEAHEIRENLEHVVDLVVDGGACSLEPTTVLDLTGETPELLRQGQGIIENTPG